MRLWFKDNITRLLVWTCAGLIVAGGLLMAGAYTYAKQRAASQIEQKMGVIAETNSGVMLRHMEAYGDVLYAMRGLFAATDVDAASWQRFIQSQSAPDRFTGMKSVAYAEVVPQQDAAAFTQSMRHMYGDDVAIHPAKDTDDYVVLAYHEDLAMTTEAHRAVLGFDLTSDAVRGSALQRAAAHGSMAATEPISLISTGNQGFLLVLPLTERYGHPGDDVFGYAVVAIDMQEFVTKALGGQLNRNEVSVIIADKSGGEPGVLHADILPAHPTESREVEIQVADRIWLVTYAVPVTSLLTAPERYAATGILILGIGTIFGVSMVAYVLRLRYRLRCSVTSKD